MSTIKYPDIEVQLTGIDGNAFNVMGTVKRALARNGVDKTEVNEFLAEAMSGDYNNLLAVAAKWVSLS